MILYVNGCSWSAYSDINAIDKVYGNYLSEKLNCTLINHSIPSSSNDQIVRSTVRNLQNIISTNKEEDIVCVLNITTLTRNDFWDAGLEIRNKCQHSGIPIFEHLSKKLEIANDGDYTSYNIKRADYIEGASVVPGFALHVKSYVANYHYEREYYELYYKLFMLVTYLKSNNIKYLIFAGHALLDKDSENLDKRLSWISAFRDPIINDPGVLDFDKINFCHWTHDNGYKMFDSHQWNLLDPYGRPYGHPDTKAHAAWADFLYNKLTELYGPL